MLLNGRYEVHERIGAGSFGVVYKGLDRNTGRTVAIKMESCNSRVPQLLYEYKVYTRIQGPHIPEVYEFLPNVSLPQGEYNILIFQYFDRSLEDLFVQCRKRFSVKTVVQIALQLLEALQHLHGKGFLHRDLKPENLMFDSATKKIYVIDFGLAKRYRDPETHVHISYKENKHLTGTPRYASINSHLGIQCSRRDDMESMDYILMYFLRGSLPWQGYRAHSKRRKYQKIMEKKLATPIDLLHNGYPDEFRRFAEYARCLRFADKPDYGAFNTIFLGMAQRLQIDLNGVYDWDHLAPVVSPIQLPTVHEDDESVKPAEHNSQEDA
jgi:serine/threonine protein kinase